MSDLTPNDWANIGYVTSGFSLLAFVVAGAVTAYKANLTAKVEILKDTNSRYKTDVLDRLLEHFSIDAKNLTKEQKCNLILEQVKISRHKLNVQMFCFCFASLIFAGVAYASIQNKNQQELKIEENKRVEAKKEAADKLAQEKKEAGSLAEKKKEAEILAAEKLEKLKEAEKEREASEERARKDSLNGMLKIPLGASVEFVDNNVAGSWELLPDGVKNGERIISHKDGVYLSSQTINNVDFEARTSFRNGYAYNAELLKREEWQYKKYNLTSGATYIDTTKNKENVDDICFGEKYSEINNLLINFFGHGVLSKKVDDKSSGMGFVTSACVNNSDALGACAKKSSQELRVSHYNVSGYKLAFEAVKDDLSRLENRESYAELKMGVCSWKLKYSRST